MYILHMRTECHIVYLSDEDEHWKWTENVEKKGEIEGKTSLNVIEETMKSLEEVVPWICSSVETSIDRTATS